MGGRLPPNSPYAAVLWYYMAEMGQDIGVLSLPPEIGEQVTYICNQMLPWRLKYLAEIAAKP